MYNPSDGSVLARYNGTENLLVSVTSRGDSLRVVFTFANSQTTVGRRFSLVHKALSPGKRVSKAFLGTACIILTYFVTLPCPALPCLALPCPALPCLALPCPALPCLALPCPALPCLALPCPALPCLALPCPALPCLALPCLTLRLPLVTLPCLTVTLPYLTCLVMPHLTTPYLTFC